MSSAATLTVRPVTVPARLELPEARDFLAMADVFNTALEHDLGYDHLRWVPSELLPGWQDQTYRLQRGFVARDGDRAVGALQLTVPREQGAPEVEFDLLTAPGARGLGVEERLLDTLYAEAGALGRSVVQTYTLHRADAPGDRMPSPSGFGAVPVDRESRFYLAQGFTLQQVERNSVLDLQQPLERTRAMLAQAQAVAGPDYRLVTWTLPTPPERRTAFAEVIARMSTDVPTGDLTWTPEVWDADRVAQRDRRILDGGLTVSVAAVEHVPTGDLVAYSELAIGADPHRPTDQWGTLVVTGHRGRRLGTVVKCANALRWQRIAPQSPFISTFNAEENRHMLDVNEAMGFRPLTVAGAWQKRLAGRAAAAAGQAARTP